MAPYFFSQFVKYFTFPQTARNFTTKVGLCQEKNQNILINFF